MINGVVAVPIIAAMMYVASRRGQMGRYRAGKALLALGWTATAVMAAASVSMIAAQIASI